MFLLSYTLLFSQPPCFEFPSNKKTYCVNETVSVIDCFFYPPGSNIAIANYDFIDVDTFKLASSHIYDKPGKYKIEALGGSPISRVSDFVTILGPTPPPFTIGRCEGRKVSVRIQNPTPEKYTIDFGNGVTKDTAGVSSGVLEVDTIFPDVSSRTINVKGQCSSYGTPITVTPFQSLSTPQITKLTKNDINKTFTLEFTAISYLKYRIDRGNTGGTFAEVERVSNASGTVSKTYSTDGNLGDCFKVVAYDDCGAELPSDICAIVNPTAAPYGSFNSISWTPDPLKTYEIVANSILLGTYPPSPTTISVDHQNSVCGRDYYYTIRATSPAPIVEAILLPIKGKANSLVVPTKVENINSTIVGSTVQLQWDKPTAFTVKKYLVLRSANNEPYIQIAETQKNFFTDNKVSFTNNRYCYQIQYEDSCGFRSVQSFPTCPIILKTEDVSTNGVEGFKSVWTTYIGSILTPTYVLEKLDLSNNVIETLTPPAPDTTFTDLNVDTTSSGIRYRVKITQGASVFYSNIFTIKFEARITAPNAFTPNGDNVNDVFRFYGKYVKSFTMYIYNRWGEMVFSTETLGIGWDGTYQNKEAIVDDYSYVIEAVDNEGKKVIERGTLSLLR